MGNWMFKQMKYLLCVDQQNNLVSILLSKEVEYWVGRTETIYYL